MNEYREKVDALTAELVALDQQLDTIMTTKTDPAGKPRAVLLAEVIARSQTLFANRQVAEQKLNQLRAYEDACREHSETVAAAIQAEFIAGKARVVAELAQQLSHRGQIGLSHVERLYSQLRDAGFAESTLDNIKTAYPRPDKKAVLTEAEAEYQRRIDPAEAPSLVK